MKKSILFIFSMFIFIGCGNDTATKNILNIDSNILYNTNQSEVYVKGDDGFFQKGLKRIYKAVDDKYIIEENKQMYWQDSEEILDLQFTQDEAENYCSNLNLGGFTDWRLPTIYELFELNDYSLYDGSIDKSFQNRINKGYIWSSTDCGVCKAKAFAISADMGDVYRFMDENKFSVRCVRGKKYNMSVYERNTTLNIVTDKIKRLMWQDKRTEEVKQKTFEEAVSYCYDLDFNGFNDWRLPNIIELRSLYDFTNGSRSMSLIFDSVVMETPYWSSTTSSKNDSRAWGLDFRLSDSKIYSKDSLFAVRCVRDMDGNDQ